MDINKFISKYGVSKEIDNIKKYESLRHYYKYNVHLLKIENYRINLERLEKIRESEWQIIRSKVFNIESSIKLNNENLFLDSIYKLVESEVQSKISDISYFEDKYILEIEGVDKKNKTLTVMLTEKVNLDVRKFTITDYGINYIPYR